ncbi:DUF3899 domain-containing protein [Sporosarcina limicola]|uniref:Membrane protein n=1 Tax=Sporosarcina limicola TaxID=34101 RepID=A0A927MKL5_9BACL|nr:DUF3899 domain-containing protein [Sporosarcina limicola]MBE1553284.1 putative membrane protein [Sporosarcina limicola]
MKDRSLILLAIIFTVSVSILLLFFSESIIYFFDGIFYIGLILLIIGSVLMLIQAEFFNAFVKSSKYFFSAVSKKEQVIRDVESRKINTTSYKRQFSITNYFLLLGLLYCVISLIGSIV